MRRNRHNLGRRNEYGDRLDAIHERIAARLGEKPVVFYSAYKTDARELPVDNLNEIPIQGEIQFHAKHDPFWGTGRSYKSAVVDSPTWLEIAVLANDMIKTTGDFHHQFLEGVEVVAACGKVKSVEFMMGS
jgi:hypothetical protein